MTSVTPAGGYPSPNGSPPRQTGDGGFFALLLALLGIGLLAGGVGRAGYVAASSALLEAPLALALVVGGMGALATSAVLTTRGRSAGPGALLLVLSIFLTVSSAVGMATGMQMRSHWYWIADRFGFETAAGLEVMLMTGVLPMIAAVLLGGAMGARRTSQRSEDGPGPAGSSPAGTVGQPGGPVTPGLTVSTVDSSLTRPSGPSASAGIAALVGTVGALGGTLWTVTHGVQAMRDALIAVNPVQPLALMVPGVIVLGAAAYLVRWTRLHLWLTGATLLGLTVVASVLPAELSSALAPIMGDASHPMIALYLPTGLILGLAMVLPGVALGSRMHAPAVTRPRADWAQGNTAEQPPGSTQASGQPGAAPPHGSPAAGQWQPPSEGTTGTTGTFGDSSSPYGPPGPHQRF